MKTKFFRWGFYVTGMLILAIGLTLNTKTDLGVSAVMMVPYVISEIWKLNFGNTTLILYTLFVAAQILLHWTAAGKTNAATLIRDILQLPLSLLFTRVINLISSAVPMLNEAYPGSFPGSLPGRITVLIIAVICTGVGASMTLNMRLIPNPGDGIVQTLAERAEKKVGFVKNCFDLACVILSCLICLLFNGAIIGVGIGTLVAALGVGRVMHLFERVCRSRILCLAGLQCNGGQK